MKKTKTARTTVILECTKCRESKNALKAGVSRYITEKNKKNTTTKLGLSKHCKFCNMHTPYQEVR